jgi:hypothetical protein
MTQSEEKVARACGTSKGKPVARSACGSLSSAATSVSTVDGCSHTSSSRKRKKRVSGAPAATPASWLCIFWLVRVASPATATRAARHGTRSAAHSSVAAACCGGAP